MEVNGKLIKGIFLYEQEVKYTEGDFVVEDDKMYVCTESSLGDLPSSSPTKFRPYLGARTDGEVEDGSISFISSLTLGKYLSGTCNMKGTIPNNIDANREAFFRDFFGDESGLSLGNKYLDPLDNLIVSPDIKQTVVNVDKSIVEGLIGTCNSNPILRQYEYETGDLYTRVQELINVDFGDLYFRTSSKTVPPGDQDNADKYSWSAPTDWKNVSVNGNYTSVISQIKATYNQKCNDLELLKTKLIGAFRFKKLEGSHGKDEVEIFADQLTSSVVTINLVDKTGGKNMSSSLTIDLESSITNYALQSGGSISIIKPGVGYNIRTSPDVTIQDIYVRIPYNYNPSSLQTTRRMMTIPVEQVGNSFKIMTTGSEGNIKITLPSVFDFTFPASESRITVGGVVVERQSDYFRMTMPEEMKRQLTDTPSAAYV